MSHEEMECGIFSGFIAEGLNDKTAVAVGKTKVE